MNKPYFIIRLLTVLSYFLPFIFFLSTCTSVLTTKVAYNKEDAILNEQEKVSNQLSSIDSFVNEIDTSNMSYMLTELQARVKQCCLSSDNISHLNRDFQYRLIVPTNYSLSAIGSIWFHKNLFGKTMVTISLMLSFILLLFYRILERKKVIFQIVSTNIIILVFFIADNILSNVTTLFGTWTLLFLLLVQLTIERQKRKSANQ